MPVLESEIEGYLRQQVEALGGECHKFIPDIKRGMPDRLCLLPEGIVFWVETKKPKGGVVAPAQVHRHKCLRALGQRVYIAYTRADVDRIIAENKKSPTA